MTSYRGLDLTRLQKEYQCDHYTLKPFLWGFHFTERPVQHSRYTILVLWCALHLEVVLKPLQTIQRGDISMIKRERDESETFVSDSDRMRAPPVPVGLYFEVEDLSPYREIYI